MNKIIPGMFCLLVWLLLAAPSQGHAAIQSANPVTHGKSWAQQSTVEKVQLVCALSVGLVLFVAEVMFIVAGFKTSTGWGLFMLFIGGMRSVGAAIVMIAWMVRWMLLTHHRQPFQLPP